MSTTTLVHRLAREAGVDGPWTTLMGLTHAETAREFAKRLGASPVVVETRDASGGDIFRHRVRRVVEWKAEPTESGRADQ
jgi:hypothetical protein